MSIEGVEAVRVPAQGTSPALPHGRGPLSDLLIATLRRPAPSHPESTGPAADLAQDGELGEDFQLALYLLYELHYRGFAGVDERWEWNAGLLALRAELEAEFEATLRERLPVADIAVDPTTLGAAINHLIEPTRVRRCTPTWSASPTSTSSGSS